MIATNDVVNTFSDRSPRVLGGVTDDAPAIAFGAVPIARWSSRAGSGRQFFWACFLLLVLTQITLAFAVISPQVYLALAVARRVTWLVVTLVAVFEVLRARPDDLLGPLVVFIPFVLVGTVSALLSVEPSQGIADIALWLMAMLAACVVGQKCRGTNLPGVLAIWFAGVLLASIVVVILLPRIGLMTDGRVAHGTWRGVFVHKNWLAWYAGFAALLAAFAGSVRIPGRIVLGGVALACLHWSHSAGSVLAAVAVMAMMAIIALWRRWRLSPGLQVIASSLVLSLVGGAGWVGYRGMLAAVGRDVTLTGRTTIWEAYTTRALDTWLIGAGPGSFTELSLATQDVSLRMQNVGKIYTPHNMFIAVFGETGLIGLLAYGFALGAIIFGELGNFTGKGRPLVLAFTLFFLVSGLDETHEVFGVGSGLFLIMLLRAWHWPQLQETRRPLPAPVANHGALFHGGN